MVITPATMRYNSLNPAGLAEMAERPERFGITPRKVIVSQSPSPRPEAEPAQPKVEVQNLSFHYGARRVLKDITVTFGQNQVTALIGPSGCGKTTLLRCFNRMHDLYPGNRYEGRIILHPDQVNIVDPAVDPIEMRLRLGMVFQKPNPYPKSIFENVAFGLRLRGIRGAELEDRVVGAIKDAALWEETKDRLRDSAYDLSGGQQQRLCLARALATGPELLLFDEPTSALDPVATARIEELIVNLKSQVTILIVTHNMQQASRISDFTGFLYLGELVEFGPTDRLFTNPTNKLTDAYITGRFG
jgi:phosphate transport system ATP-binding protein